MFDIVLILAHKLQMHFAYVRVHQYSEGKEISMFVRNEFKFLGGNLKWQLHSLVISDSQHGKNFKWLY